MYNNTTGSDNIAIGTDALEVNTTGSDNIAIGPYAMDLNTTGSLNVALGYQALEKNVSGERNIAIGYLSMQDNTTGDYNVVLGDGAMPVNTTGYNNVAIGRNSLPDNTYEYGNTAVGYNAFTTAANVFNSTAIGQGTPITSSNQVRLGNTAITTNGGNQPWSNYSDSRMKINIKQDIPGLAFIKLLRPVSYQMDMDKMAMLLNIPDSIRDRPGELPAASIHHTGFIAQEVEAAAQSIGYDFSGIDKDAEGNQIYALRYSTFTVPLVKAVQELSQENESLKAALSAQTQILQQYGTELEALRAEISQVKLRLQN
jgi:trimeric autotransporter adhesin